MEEKLLREMISLLNDIREKLSVGQSMAIRGPVADPGPEAGRPWFPRRPVPFPVGHHVFDPAPEFFFSKEELARIKVKELDITITQINDMLDLTRLERDILAKEYKIK